MAGFWARVRGCSESSSWKHASQRWTATTGPAKMQRIRLLHPSQDKFPEECQQVHGSLFIRCNVRSHIFVGTCLYQRSGIVAVDFHNGPIRFCRRYGFAWAAAKVCAFRCHSIFCVLRGKVFRHFTKDSNILKERDRLGDDTCRKFCTVYGPVNYMQLSYHPQGTVTIAHVSSGSMSAAADPGGGVLRALSGLERICAEAEVGNTRKI